MDKTIEKVNVEAIEYLTSGKMDGLTGEDVAKIDFMVEQQKILHVQPIMAMSEMDSRPFYSKTALFGGPAVVQECIVVREDAI